MITPEFIDEKSGEFHFVASHALENEEAVGRSIEFNLGRISLARAHLPPALKRCVLTYDIRGQRVSDQTRAAIATRLSSHCTVRFMEL